MYNVPCDMRKGFNGLSGLVRNELGREATSRDVFIFLNHPRTHLKLLHWERGGFVLYYKRLERGNFTRPKYDDTGAISWTDLMLILEGIGLEKRTQKLRYAL